jgi:hypothetical protein
VTPQSKGENGRTGKGGKIAGADIAEVALAARPKSELGASPVLRLNRHGHGLFNSVKPKKAVLGHPH